MVMSNPLALSNLPTEAAVTPLPTEEITPPVKKISFVAISPPDSVVSIKSNGEG